MSNDNATQKQIPVPTALHPKSMYGSPDFTDWCRREFGSNTSVWIFKAHKSGEVIATAQDMPDGIEWAAKWYLMTIVTT